MLKKFPSDKINGTKKALFFLSESPTYHSLDTVKNVVSNSAIWKNIKIFFFK